MTAIPEQRNPNAHRPPPPDPADIVVRVDLHRSPAGQLVKVEVFGDFSTRITSQVAGRWHHTSWRTETKP